MEADCWHALPLLRTGRQQVLVLLLQSLLQGAVLTYLEKDLVEHAVRQLSSALVERPQLFQLSLKLGLAHLSQLFLVVEVKGQGHRHLTGQSKLGGHQDVRE